MKIHQNTPFIPNWVKISLQNTSDEIIKYLLSINYAFNSFKINNVSRYDSSTIKYRNFIFGFKDVRWFSGSNNILMIDSRLQPQASGSQEGNLRCRVDGGIKTASPTNSRRNQRRAAKCWFTDEAICGPLPPLKRFLQCFHPVHTIVSVSDWPGLVRSGQHCQGFPVALNDFLCIQMGNNVVTFSYLPCTQFRKIKEPFD